MLCFLHNRRIASIACSLMLASKTTSGLAAKTASCCCTWKSINGMRSTENKSPVVCNCNTYEFGGHIVENVHVAANDQFAVT